MTTSIGVSVVRDLPQRLDAAQAEDLLELLLEESDHCLYEAKAAGRSRVVGPREPLSLTASLFSGPATPSGPALRRETQPATGVVPSP